MACIFELERSGIALCVGGCVVVANVLTESSCEATCFFRPARQKSEARVEEEPDGLLPSTASSAAHAAESV